MSTRRERIESIASEASAWRRELHQNPQVMYEEEFASAFIARKLTDWDIPHESGIARTGVVATIEGLRNESGRAIAFRADMDALKIEEKSGQPWSSKNPGTMHGCGHDGHTATLLALARYLRETRNFDGLIRLIFQPAEEGGRGAFQMLDEGLLERFPFDEIYGYHNWPGLPSGVFAIRPGAMLAAVDIFTINLSGKGGHAAMPHLTHDVVPALSQLVLALQTLISRETDPQASAVVSVTNLSAGTGALNVIGDFAQLSGTVRTFNPVLRDHLERRIRALTEAIANAFELRSEVNYQRLIDPTINEPVATLRCQTAAAAIVGEENVRELEPVMGGEDFSGFLGVRPGAFMIIGQGESNPDSPYSQGLHTPFYDFNDAIIPIAANYFAELAETRLALD